MSTVLAIVSLSLLLPGSHMGKDESFDLTNQILRCKEDYGNLLEVSNSGKSGLLLSGAPETTYQTSSSSSMKESWGAMFAVRVGVQPLK